MKLTNFTKYIRCWLAKRQFKDILISISKGNKKTGIGFCFSALLTDDQDLNELSQYELIWRYKTQDSYWFPLDKEGMEKRIEILDESINYYESKLNVLQRIIAEIYLTFTI